MKSSNAVFEQIYTPFSYITHYRLHNFLLKFVLAMTTVSWSKKQKKTIFMIHEPDPSHIKWQLAIACTELWSSSMQLMISV